MHTWAVNTRLGAHLQPSSRNAMCPWALWAGEGVLTSTDTQTQSKDQQVWLAQH